MGDCGATRGPRLPQACSLGGARLLELGAGIPLPSVHTDVALLASWQRVSGENM